MPHSTAHPWTKKVLVPFWTLQILLSTSLIILYSITTASLSTLEADNNGVPFANAPYSAVIIAAIIVIVVLALALLLTLVQIILYARTRLSPLCMLILQVVQSAILTVLWAISIAGAVDGGGMAFVIMTVVVVCFWGTLVYGAVIYHRDRMAKRGEKYASLGVEAGRCVTPESGVLMERGSGFGKGRPRLGESGLEHPVYRPYEGLMAEGQYRA